MSVFLLMFVLWEYVYAYFVYIQMTSSGPGCQSQEPFFWLGFLLETRLWYKSLEGLMDFLAFLVPKLWPKCHKSIREISTNPQRHSWNIWIFLAIILDPEMLESQSRALKTHIKPKIQRSWAKKSAHWINWCHPKKRKTYPHPDLINQKPQTHN